MVFVPAKSWREMAGRGIGFPESPSSQNNFCCRRFALWQVSVVVPGNEAYKECDLTNLQVATADCSLTEKLF